MEESRNPLWRQYRRHVTPTVFDIAYSTIGLAPVKTAEHYLLAAQLGFPALKGNIRRGYFDKRKKARDKEYKKAR